MSLAGGIHHDYICKITGDASCSDVYIRFLWSYSGMCDVFMHPGVTHYVVVPVVGELCKF